MNLRAASGILIPAYDAAASLSATLVSVLGKTDPGRIAVIDDGSKDGTAEVAEKSGVVCLRHAANRGKGSALMTGLSWARERGWEWAVTLDADGQHAASDLDAFWNAPVAPDTGIVVGRRGIRGTRMPWHRRFSNTVTTRMISRLARRPVYDAQCGFRMYRLAAVEAMGLPREGRFEWESQALVLCGRRGFSIMPVDIATVYTDNGSHMRLFRDTLRFLKMYFRLAALPEAAWTR
ncbi:MAG: glycosyltransferase family 2 protein [Fibrobacteres bacterium]|nr:glycosyltransferase family 2 protein [Fibrobacterota bacterium]